MTTTGVRWGPGADKACMADTIDIDTININTLDTLNTRHSRYPPGHPTVCGQVRATAFHRRFSVPCANGGG